MTMNAIHVAPPNSLILIEDAAGGEVPKSRSRSLVAATPSCVAVGCRAEDDGKTEIVLAPSTGLKTLDRLEFEGSIRTPSMRVVVRTVHGETLLELPVPGRQTALKIWASDPMEPDRITVGVDI